MSEELYHICQSKTNPNILQTKRFKLGIQIQIPKPNDPKYKEIEQQKKTN